MPPPDMKASPKQLDIVANMIDAQLKTGKKVLVHCAAGMERSPLAIMWYLMRKKGMDLKDAYSFVKARRPMVMDSLDWLN